MNRKVNIGEVVNVQLIIVLGLAFFMVGQVKSQTLNFKKFNLENGLPSNVIYEIAQDKQGYIWFGTENGLCRYDGQDFRVFTKEDGLTNNEVLKLHVASDGQVYFLEYGEGINCFNKGVMRHVHKAKEVGVIKNFHKNNFIESPDGLLLGGLVVRDSLYVNEDFKAFNYANTYTYVSKGDSCVFDVKDYTSKPITRHIHRCYDMQYTFSGASSMFIDVIGRSNEFFEESFRSVNGVFRVEKESLPFRLFDQIFSHCGAKLPFHLNRVSETEFYVSDQEGLLYVRHHGMEIVQYEWLFRGKVAVYSFIDDKGGLWVATHGDGLYYAPSRDIKCLNQANGELVNDNVREIYKGENGLYISYYDNQLEIKREGKRIIRDLKDQEGRSFFIARFFPFKDKLGFVSNKFPVGFVEHDGQLDIFELPMTHNYFETTKSFYYEKENNYYYLGGYNYHFERNNGISRRYYSDDHSDIPARDIIRYKGDIWLAQENGVKTLKDGKFVRVEDELLKGIMYDFEVGGDSVLWIGTEEHGLLRYEEGHVSAYSEHLAGGVKRVVCQGDSILWTLSPEGLTRIKLINGIPEEFQLINKDNGLSTNAITGICYHNDTLWLSTQKGVNYFDTRSLEIKKKVLKCSINSISVNGNLQEIQEDYQLNADERHVEISFSAPVFDRGGKVRYEYRLQNESEEWIPIKNNILEFPVIPFGENEIEIRAKASEYEDSQIVRVRFHVPFPYYQSGWFYVVVIIALAGGIYSVFSYQYSRKLKRKNAMTELELRNLRSQMNPHFIFNGLVSVQHSLKEKNSESALAYLLEFSKLMRHILESSRNEFVDMRKEVDLLNFYLKLESEKAGDSFEYVIHVDQEVEDEEILIPPMIIQPFIENSILHGVLPLKNRKGKIDIHVSFRDEKTVLVVVEDNGIGREEAKRLKEKRGKHNSVGISNTIDRLKMTLRTKEEVVSYIDLLDEKGNSLGTKVQIIVPYEGWD